MVIAIPGMFLLCCALICPCCHARRKETAHAALPKEPNSMDSVFSFGVSSTSERIPGGSPLPASPLRVPPSPFRVPPSPSRFSSSPQLSRVASIHLNMSQINKATRNFSPALMLGEGGFGTVYRAQLQDGQVVAIKRAKKEHFDALRTEFSSEVELLAKIEHRNLVKLLGYFDKGNERIIITEYVPNGTLKEYLDEKPIIHRDVKSSNILLTESMRAKVADFGFARLAPIDADQTHISTKVKGTAGYLI
ncbi:calmodulin-binding receptor-like cytoplasmic kinase 3 [Tasmannia lanceolata]|uniref:calmodulin-binding receptor-like cytoplasmic kinase 3 n=1 Tax=Tasmannia lanceolata TaxID=3420 RepID=UPI0040630EFA